jgi:uncharacterized protein (TIGR02145 family)
LTKSKAVTVLDCINPAVATLTASASGFCAGGEGVAFGLSDTENGAKYRLYHGATPVGAELTGSGSAATFSGTFNAAGMYTAVSVADGVYCAVSMNGARNISENPTPAAPVISSSGDVCQNGGNIEFTATGYSGTLEWVSDGGGVKSLFNVTFGSSVTDTKTVTARSAQTYTDAPTCYSAEVSQSATVNPLPAAPTGVNNARCGAGTLTLSASSSGAVIEWYDAASGGTSLYTGNSYTPSITESTTYYAQARIAATGCVSARTAVLATINPIPAAPTMSGGGAYCGGSLNITATAGSGGNGIRWTDNGSTVSLRSVATSGTYYAVTTSAAGCESGTASVAVTINPVPGIPAMGGGGTQCGGSRDITAAAGSGGDGIRWTDNSSTVSLRTVTASGTYYAVTTSAAGCESGTASVAVTINPVPGIPAMGGGGTQCGGSRDITATPGSGGNGIRWTDNGSTVSLRNVTASGTYYAVTTSAEGCESGTASVAVTINTVPAITASAGDSRCGQGTLTLSATPSSGAVIDWYNAASGGTSLYTGNSYTPDVTTSTTYYAQARIAATGCVSARMAVTAAVNTVLANPAVTHGARCGAGTLTLSATPSAGAVIDWYDNATGGTSLYTGNSYTPDVTTSTTYYAQARIEATGCVSARIAVLATINPAPAPPTMSGGGTQCGGSLNITATAGSGGNGIRWTDNSSTVSPRSITTSGTYYAVTTSAAGCESGTASVAVTINPVPEAPTMGGGGTQCGGSRDITATAGSGGNGIRWTDNSSTVSLRTVTVSGTYYAVTTSAAGCESGTASVAVTINTVPAITASAGDSRCGAGTVTLSASSSGAVIDWYDAASGGTSLHTGNSYTPDVTTSTTYYAQARIEATGCVSARTAVLATVVPNPTITTQPVATSACAGGTVQLSVAANNATAYQWRKNGVNVTDGSGGTTTHYVTGALSASATYSVVVSNGGACTVTSADAAVTVHTAPTAPTGLSSNITAICNGVVTDITLTAADGAVGSGAVYEWGTGSAVGSNPLSPATTTANTRTVSTSAAVTSWVRLKGTTSCTTVTGGVTTAIGIHPAVVPGAIQTASATTTEGTAPAVTVNNVTAASGGSGNLTYVWRRTGTSSATLTGAAATYAINSDASNYSTAGTYYFNRYVKDNTCNTTAAASGTYTLLVELPPPPSDFASTQTWTFGSQTWSDRVVASPSNCTQTTSLTTSNYTTAEYKISDGRYYYSWTCAVNAQSTLCPSPWRLPSWYDFDALVRNTNYATLTNAWGFGGYARGNTIHDVSTVAYYWCTTQYGSNNSYELHIESGSLLLNYSFTFYGFQLRCVKD